MSAVAPIDAPRAVDPLNAEWVTVILLVVFAVLAMTNLSSPRKWRLLSQAMFRMRLGRQALREELSLQDRTLIGLLVAAAAVTALFAWQAFVEDGGEPVLRTYLVRLGAVTGAVIAQAIVLRTLSAVLQVDRGLDEYLYTGLLLFILLGTVLLPLTVLLTYHPEWRPAGLVIGTIAAGVLLVYRWVRGAWIGLGEGVPFRYIILYLCTAEILPVLLLVDASRHPVTPH